MGEQQDIPILDPQRRRFAVDPQVATTGAEDVEGAVWTGRKVKAPGRSYLRARMQPVRSAT
jgi:hypothetical protein